MDLTNAERFLRQSLEIRLSLLGAENPETANTTAAMSKVVGLLGKASEAEILQLRALGLHRKLYGESHVLVAEDLDALASLLYDGGEFEQSVAMSREALRRYEAALGSGGAEVANVRIHLGNTLERAGNLREAESNIRAGMAIHAKMLGPHHPLTIGAQHSLANILRSAGNYAEAEKIETGVVAWQRGKDPHDPLLAYYLALLGSAKRARGDFKAAESDLRDYVEIFRKTYGEAHLLYARSITSEALNRMSMGEAKGPEASLRRAIAVIRKADHSNPSDLSFPLVGLAQNLLLQGRAGGGGATCS